jgi:hypothetical protein
LLAGENVSYVSDCQQVSITPPSPPLPPQINISPEDNIQLFSLASMFTHHVVNGTKWGAGSFKDIDSPVKELMEQYNCFQNVWMKKMKAVHQE